MHIHIHIHIAYTCIHAHTHPEANISTHIHRVHIHPYLCICICIHLYVQTYARTFTYGWMEGGTDRQRQRRRQRRTDTHKHTCWNGVRCYFLKLPCADIAIAGYIGNGTAFPDRYEKTRRVQLCQLCAKAAPCTCCCRCGCCCFCNPVSVPGPSTGAHTHTCKQQYALDRCFRGTRSLTSYSLLMMLIRFAMSLPCLHIPRALVKAWKTFADLGVRWAIESKQTTKQRGNGHVFTSTTISNGAW